MTSSHPAPDRLRLDSFHLPEDLRPGTQLRTNLTALNAISGTVHVPALLARGSRPGPTLMVTAGVHGDEFEGMEAVRRVYEQLDPTRMAGAFIGLPVCNPFAYEGQLRTTPGSIDGLNLARVFPGDPNGLPTQRLADQLFQFTLRHLTESDLFVDLHSAGTRYELIPLCGFRLFDNTGREPSEEASRHFGIDQIWGIETSAGMFNTETARRNIPTVGTEITGQGGCRPADVDLYANGLTNLLRFKGIVDGPVPPRNNSPMRRAIFVSTPVSGFLTPTVAMRDRVRAGQVIGRVTSMLGDELGTVTSPVDGHAWCVRTFSSIYAGEVAFWIAPE